MVTITSQFPASKNCLDFKNHQAQAEDPVCFQLMTFSQTTWPGSTKSQVN